MSPFHLLRKCFRQTAFLAGLVTSAVLVLGLPAAAQAQSLIRDAEIEHALRSYSDPIFAAAGLAPKDINIYIVNDPQVNAFVAGGQNLFVNTGTIMRLDRPRELIGIIAHETGHIAGGHLARAAEGYAKATTVPLILGTLLGIAAMASGAGDAGAGILMGGQNVAVRSALAYSREQEAKADQAAVTYLDRVHESARGLLETFEIFRNDEILSARRINPYLQNHPLSDERIGALEHRVDASPYKDVPETPAQIKSFKRIQAKLYGFLDRPDLVLRKYPLTDKSVEARYARAIAYYRIPDLTKAFAELDPLIAAEPDNPYFHELKGQILFENGHADEAIPEHRRAAALMPSEPLLKVNLGQALVATENPKDAKQAIDVLEAALRQDPDNTFAWHEIAIAYAQNNQIGMAELATAEKLYRSGGARDALIHAERALCGLTSGTPAARRARDIIETTRAQAELDGRGGRNRRDEDMMEDKGARKGPRCENFGDAGDWSGAGAVHRQG